MKIQWIECVKIVNENTMERMHKDSECKYNEENA